MIRHASPRQNFHELSLNLRRSFVMLLPRHRLFAVFPGRRLRTSSKTFLIMLLPAICEIRAFVAYLVGAGILNEKLPYI